jgi:histidinol-phosphate/aromatic aminotransferase/cobyric acid decarboxylase-like protein
MRFLYGPLSGNAARPIGRVSSGLYISDIGLNAEAFTDVLGEQGILIRGDFLKEYVRIFVGTMLENKKLLAAAKRVLASFKK